MDDMKYYLYDASGGIYDPETTTPPFNATNKLAYIEDAVSSGNYTTDIDNQASGNYDYDAIGNLKKDLQEEIDHIDWTVYGKVKSVTRTTGSNKDDLEFRYDPAGNRILKIAKPRSGGNPGSSNNWVYTVYTRDAQGNTLATYNLTGVINDMKLKEQYMYGSSRIGILNRNVLVGVIPSTTDFTTERGEKNYEMGNHLGNVLAVVNDQKIPHNNSGTLDYYNAKTISATDYYAFGAQMLGRQFNSNFYRFGFGSHEKDDEVSGSGNAYDFNGLGYDPRTGRRKGRDPKNAEMPYASPYSYGLNNPILFIDKDGEKPRIVIAKSDDGKNITISITNKIYIVNKTGNNNASVDNNKINTYLKGGSYKEGDVNYTVVIQNEIIAIETNADAAKRIKADDYVGVIVDLGKAASSPQERGESYHAPGAIDQIHLEKYRDLEKVLSHEVGHDLGFADKYIEAGGDEYTTEPFQNGLMGGHTPLNEYEVQLIGSDVMKQYGDVVKNGETVDLTKEVGAERAVITTDDEMPKGIAITGYSINDSKKKPVQIKVTSKPTAPKPQGKIIPEKLEPSK